MRHFLQPQRFPHIGELLKQLANTTVVRLEKMPEHENREKLVLGEILARAMT
jgi:hypothetical protein